MLRPVLRESRVLDVPELDALHHAIEVRTPALRLGVHHGRSVSSDFGVVERAAPFVHRMTRPCLTLVFEGHGRFDEHGRRFRVDPGDLVLSDQCERGTEAYAGSPARWLVMDWDPTLVGARYAGAVSIARLGRVDLARLSKAAGGIGGPRSAEASAEIVRVLRSLGVGFERLAAADLARAPASDEQQLATAIGDHLSNLRAHPALEDLVSDLGWNARLVHRRMATNAKRYGLPWEHWRALLHHMRVVSALRLLSAPGATTELVARLTGFRSPSALCHTFDDAGLPSPGAFVRAAKRDVIEGWADHAAPTHRAA
jgi:AraC-like DNA-binding protein